MHAYPGQRPLPPNQNAQVTRYLRVGHRPGTTAADGTYRYFETLFGPAALIARHESLQKMGLDLRVLDPEILRSIELITEQEVLARLYSDHMASQERTELDALATIIRLAHAVAQRRGRAREKSATHILAVADRTLGSVLHASVMRSWRKQISILTDHSSPTWLPNEVSAVADYAPSSIVLSLLESSGREFPWASALRISRSLDWIVRDLALIFRRYTPVPHVAPIADLLLNYQQRPRFMLNDGNARSVILQSVYLMDERCSALSTTLTTDGPFDTFELSHFTPPYELSLKVFVALEAEGIV